MTSWYDSPRGYRYRNLSIWRASYSCGHRLGDLGVGHPVADAGVDLVERAPGAVRQPEDLRGLQRALRVLVHTTTSGPMRLADDARERARVPAAGLAERRVAPDAPEDVELALAVAREPHAPRLHVQVEEEVHDAREEVPLDPVEHQRAADVDDLDEAPLVLADLLVRALVVRDAHGGSRAPPPPRGRPRSRASAPWWRGCSPRRGPGRCRSTRRRRPRARRRAQRARTRVTPLARVVGRVVDGDVAPPSRRNSSMSSSAASATSRRAAWPVSLRGSKKEWCWWLPRRARRYEPDVEDLRAVAQPGEVARDLPGDEGLAAGRQPDHHEGELGVGARRWACCALLHV